MSEPKVEKSPRARMWVRILLAVSLALNLLFIGLAVGAAARFGGPDGRRPPPSVGAALIRALPSDHRRELRDEIRTHRSADRREQGRAEAQAIAEVLMAPRFDPDALAELAGRQLDRHHGRLAKMQGAWLERVKAMSAEDRHAYAARLQEIMSDTHDKHRWFGSDRKDR